MNHPIRLLFVVLVVVGAIFVWREVQAPISEEPIMTEEQTVSLPVTSTEFVSEQGVSLTVTYPLQNAVISSPLTITGEAPGTWYFEASFPVVLVDWDGLILAQGIATAQSDWMTEDMVSFEATIEFTPPATTEDFMKTGALILQRDNPSGLPENDDSLQIPILFAE